MARWRSLILGFLLSAFFLWIALRDLAWPAVWQSLQQAQWQYLIIAIAIWSLGLLARAVRWRVLLGDQGRLITTFHILNIGFLLNNTLPLRIGDLARAYLVGRTGASASGWTALSTIVAERIIDMLAVVLLLILVLPALAVEAAAIAGGLFMGGVAVAGFAMLLILAHRPEWAQALLRAILHLLPFLRRFALETLLNRLLEGLAALKTWRGLAGAALWTAIAWGLSVVGSWTLALVFPALPPTAIMRAALTLSVVAASFSIMVPFTLASVGPFEAAAVFALMTGGIPRESAVAYAVVWHAGTVLTYATWGALGMLGLGLSFSQIREGAAGFQPVSPATAGSADESGE